MVNPDSIASTNDGSLFAGTGESGSAPKSIKKESDKARDTPK
jgi:hypothetical protein